MYHSSTDTISSNFDRKVLILYSEQFDWKLEGVPGRATPLINVAGETGRLQTSCRLSNRGKSDLS
jgi:hypothetical protein